MDDSYNDTISRFKAGTACYLTGIAVILIPLYIRSGYFHLIEEKAFVYLLFVLPGLLTAGFLGVLSALKQGGRDCGSATADKTKTGKTENCRRENLHSSEKNSGKAACVGFAKEHYLQLLLAAIAVWSLISSLLSPDSLSSFLGMIGWSMGSLMECAVIGTTFCISAWFPVPKSFGTVDNKYAGLLPGGGKENLPYRFVPVVLTVNSIIFLFAVIQEAGVDLFGFLSGIDQFYVYSYLSTIGQKNSFAGYLCLILPLLSCFYFESDERVNTILCGAVSVLGFFCGCLADSDSLYAGIGLCLLFLLPYILYKRKRSERAGILLTWFGISLLAAGRFPLFADRVSQMGAISSAALTIPCAALVTGLGLLLYLYSHFFWRKANGSSIEGGSGRKILLWTAEGLAIAAIAAGVIYTAFHFSDSWGTNRGLIWRTGWTEFLEYSPGRKLTGIGPGLAAIPYAVLRVDPGINVVSAHCEPLHILLTQGIIGLALYVLLWAGFIALWLKNRMWKDGRAKWFFPLAAYFGHSLFCPLYPVTAALFGVAAGLYTRMAKKCDP